MSRTTVDLILPARHHRRIKPPAKLHLTKWWFWAGVLLAMAAVLIVILLMARLSQWIASDGFRGMLDEETSKGLHLEGNYTAINRIGWLGLHADSFNGTNGYKTIVSLHASDISGTFNPVGILLRRWELEDLRIKSGSVLLQKTKPSAEANQEPILPWWRQFWPDRVYLADVKVDAADILWRLKGSESGVYQTFLEITPNGRDFEYDARGGEFKTPITPSFALRHAHVLIRKARLYCSELLLEDEATHPIQQLRAKGDAGLEQDRSINLKLDFASLKISPWLPKHWRAHVAGQISGHFDYMSNDTGLETSHGRGNITVIDGVLRDLPPVDQYISLTGSPDPGDMKLSACTANVRWKECEIIFENINMECPDVFRLTGTVTATKTRALHGTLALGLTDSYLRWLPSLQKNIFSRQEGDYHFATVHLSGTVDHPEQDLSERLIKEVEKHPLLGLELFFRQIGKL